MTLGNLALTADVYRATLVERLMQFVVSNKNNTTLGFDAVLPFANTLNAFAGGLFANQPGVDFKTTVRPTVTQFLPADGDTLGNASSYALSVIANDIFGVQRVEYLVDGVVVATASESSVANRDVQYLRLCKRPPHILCPGDEPARQYDGGG